MKTKEDLKQRVMAMNEREAIKDPVMLKKSLAVLAVVLTGFVFHGMLHLQPATVALFGAGLLLLLSRTHEPHHVLAEVEWPTIFFFIGLFIIIGGVAKVGLIKWMSVKVLEITQGDMFLTSMVVMWFSAFASAFIDNIPYVATMNPLVINMAEQLWPDVTGIELLHHTDLMPLWWSLALGACLGGNGTPIGAAANVIVVGWSERIGRRIAFLKFMLYGIPIMIMTVAISMVYVWLRYYVLQI
jgi:Na+/H+ antiporter NhaD/arsenite permease-like protein